MVFPVRTPGRRVRGAWRKFRKSPSACTRNCSASRLMSVMWWLGGAASSMSGRRARGRVFLGTMVHTHTFARARSLSLSLSFSLTQSHSRIFKRNLSVALHMDCVCVCVCVYTETGEDYPALHNAGPAGAATPHDDWPAVKWQSHGAKGL